MAQREVEARLDRMTGQTQAAREYVEKETKDLEWFGFIDGVKVKGTVAELMRLNAERRGSGADNG